MLRSDAFPSISRKVGGSVYGLERMGPKWRCLQSLIRHPKRDTLKVSGEIHSFTKLSVQESFERLSKYKSHVSLLKCQ